MAGRREQGAAHQRPDEGVGRAEGQLEVEYAQLVRGLRHRPRRPGAPGHLQRDQQRRQSAGHVDEQLEGIGPDHGLQAAEEGVEQGHATHRHDGPGDIPARHQRQRDGAGKDAHPVGQEACHEKQHRQGAPRVGAEAGLQSLIGGLLSAIKVPRQKPDGHADAPDQVTQRQLQETEVATRADARDRDHRQRRGLRGHDGQHHRPGRQIARAQKVVLADDWRREAHQPSASVRTK